MLQKFIERPVLSTVISIIILILGILGIMALPIAQYPNITPPTVQVSASYPGANAQVILNSVIIPLEEQINGADNMTYMTSTASNDGSATINIYFKVGTDPDIAAVNVQNRVSRATSLLPAEVTKSGVTVVKRQSSTLLSFAVYSTNKSYDEAFLQNYVNINLLPQIKRVNGVGDASAMASHDYSMRIWLKPDVMASHSLVPEDIVSALNEQNIEAAPGAFGENGNQSFQYIIRYKGRFKEPSEYENIIIRAGANGEQLKLKDIARIELGSLSYANSSSTQGKPGVTVSISQAAGSDATEVVNETKKLIEEASKEFPDGMKYVILQDVNSFLTASITKVVRTLLEAFLLVFLVILIFLQDVRSTFIHGIAVPVSIIGTFFFLNLFGFSINLLTLFALVLAIGIVVDDAIVIVEAVHAKLEAGAKSTKEAAFAAMKEVTGAIISITLVMAAVFIPVTFIGGSAGVFYKQFGLTLAVAIIISAVNALTLSPALCVIFLKPHSETKPVTNKFVLGFKKYFEIGYSRLTAKYQKTVHYLIDHKVVSAFIILGFIALLFILMKTTPTGFVPSEDQGTIFVDITMPPASSQERTVAVADQVDKIASKMPVIFARTRISGTGRLGGKGSAYAILIFRLKPWDERKDTDIQKAIAELKAKTAFIREARITFLQAPTIQGFGTSGGFSFQLQDKTGGSLNDFFNVSNNFLAELNKQPEIDFAATSFNPNYPQYMANINVAKCKEAGITVNSILSTLQGYYGGIYASNFNDFGKPYRVMVEAEAPYRANPEGLNKIFVRNSAGTMAPITEFVSLERVYGPENISRFNLFTAMSVTGNPKPGYSTGSAIEAIKRVAKETLPPGYGFEFDGIAREELSVGNQAVMVFLLCLIFVYFLLCGQYESYILPFAVILSLPAGLCGTFIFAKLRNLDNNIYMQITLIMLIGLLAKNAILIVQYALAKRRLGMSIKDAAIEGAMIRFRPILMTSAAFIIGLLPLVFSTGAGAVGNKSIGTGAVGGMITGTALGLLVTPVLFIVFQTLHEKISGAPEPVKNATGSGSTEVNP
jgi:HAE1 family hydrophobic/amphiphilic exporter-1